MGASPLKKVVLVMFCYSRSNKEITRKYRQQKNPIELKPGFELKMVGVTELESVTSTMSTWRSNQLSYTPDHFF